MRGISLLVLVGVSGAAVKSSYTICHEDLCYPSIFVPTSEFTVVHDDQDIPPGLHVRINVTTGLKEAKIYTGTENTGEHEAIAVVPGEEVHDQPIVEQARPYPPTAPLKGSDLSVFQTSLTVLRDELSCSHKAIDALDALEELVHELEFGLKMVSVDKSDGLEVLLHHLQSKHGECRAKAALVLGSALRNNANALHALPTTFSLTSQILNAIDIEKDPKAQRMMIYALSAIMPHETAPRDYKLSAGHEIMLHTYAKGNLDIQGKIASFVEDHFAQDESSQARIRLQDNNRYGSTLTELDALDNWCNLFQKSLVDPAIQEPLRNKLLSSISQIKRANMDVCGTDKGFLTYLADEAMGKSNGNEESKAMARSARSLFGNHKASRKHGVLDL